MIPPMKPFSAFSDSSCASISRGNAPLQPALIPILISKNRSYGIMSSCSENRRGFPAPPGRHSRSTRHAAVRIILSASFFSENRRGSPSPPGRHSRSTQPAAARIILSASFCSENRHGSPSPPGRYPQIDAARGGENDTVCICRKPVFKFLVLVYNSTRPEREGKGRDLAR